MDVVVGVLALVVGAAVCISGVRLFVFMLPVWGFVTGFFAGAGLITAAVGDGFLSTTLGIVTGVVLGVAFAALSYLFWYVGVLLAAGSLGALIGGSLIGTLGATSSVLTFIVTLALAAVFVFGAIAFRLPVLLVIFLTALGGGALFIGGFLLTLGRIDRAELATTVLWERLADNWFLWIVWMISALIGFGMQWSLVDSLRMPETRWGRAQPAAAV